MKTFHPGAAEKKCLDKMAVTLTRNFAKVPWFVRQTGRVFGHSCPAFLLSRRFTIDAPALPLGPGRYPGWESHIEATSSVRCIWQIAAVRFLPVQLSRFRGRCSSLVTIFYHGNMDLSRKKSCEEKYAVSFLKGIQGGRRRRFRKSVP